MPRDVQSARDTEQDDSFAMCRRSCIAAPDPTHWDGKPWSCEELGRRSAGEYACGGPGQDCRSSQCCADPGMQCFSKNASWATCKTECYKGGPDLTDVDSTPWSCEKLGPLAPAAQPWVKDECASGWESCSQSKCCKVPGEQCHLQNDYFGECKACCPASGDASPLITLRVWHSLKGATCAALVIGCA